jgi:para-aminobenzoate synthetase component I
MPLETIEIAYFHDSAKLFSLLRDKKWAMLLDSGQAINPETGKVGSQYGRYDILVAEPFITLQTIDNETIIERDGEITRSKTEPFTLLKNLLAEFKIEQNHAQNDLSGGNFPCQIPFSGGALGYFGYDLGRSLEKLPTIAKPSQHIPAMMIGIYDWAIVVDHREKRSFLVSNHLLESTREKMDALQAAWILAPRASSEDDAKNPFFVTSKISSNLPQKMYEKAFQKVKNYIAAGDCYQVNLAQRFSAKVQGDAWQMYEKLRQLNPAPFMAYMNLPLNGGNFEGDYFQILCDSPERFLQTDGEHVETRPIKGTRPRSSDPVQDLFSTNELLTSEKDKAENVMIVDLLRNDLGKVCEIGSVKVNQLFTLQSFANVHHLVSIIVGKLKPSTNAVDLLKACFPGGSITGAPKLRAMQIIEELEPNRRELYCGTIGYVSFDGKMDTNIAIRTAIVAKNVINFYAGGGIVADSSCEKEYNETLDKASSFITITKQFTRL